MEQKNESKPLQLHMPLILQDLWRNCLLVLLAGLIGAMGVFCYARQVHTPEYTATVTFAVSPRSNGSYVGFYNSLRTASEMAEVFHEVFASNVLKRMVQADLQDPKLSVRVSTSLQAGTNILKVSTKANDPLTAYTVMESVLRNYSQVSEYLFGNVVLDTIKSPHIPTAPSNPMDLTGAYISAVLLAVFLMTAAIVVLSVSRATLKTTVGAKYHMGEAPLAVLLQEKGRGRKQKLQGLLIWKTTVSFRYTEAVLQLAHKLSHRLKEAEKKVLLVTSVAENEGKSTLSANLAIALSQQGYRVALVDCDLRKPSLHKLFGETDVCTELELVLQTGLPEKDGKRLFVLTTKTVAQPGQLLHSVEFAGLMDMLRQQMDFVILDSAPYGAVADTGMLLKYTDGSLMCVRQDWVPHPMLRAVTGELDEGSADYLGYVLNHYVDDGSLYKTAHPYKYPQ